MAFYINLSVIFRGWGGRCHCHQPHCAGGYISWNTFWRMEIKGICKFVANKRPNTPFRNATSTSTPAFRFQWENSLKLQVLQMTRSQLAVGKSLILIFRGFSNAFNAFIPKWIRMKFVRCYTITVAICVLQRGLLWFCLASWNVWRTWNLLASSCVTQFKNSVQITNVRLAHDDWAKSLLAHKQTYPHTHRQKVYNVERKTKVNCNHSKFWKHWLYWKWRWTEQKRRRSTEWSRSSATEASKECLCVCVCVCDVTEKTIVNWMRAHCRSF